ncbi:esterase-like activity of phytase family protein [Microcoleus sp. FACHB-1515]|uniref:esterase-like activity of phytase family protein n=1 Tax=Cyanophyceae TaxID=3028117 RepID=UPI00168A18E6|nr:esterase-like activity of phytase family protein [Microcoleus sp. FACHB-1515]MBD2089371.1 esterase-like activity of phytase family protein [Microcoleus sp. FACHB-1515]
MFARFLRVVLRSLLPLLLLIGLSGCSLPRVSAEERLFLDLSIDFLSAYELPRTDFEGTPVRGLSGITYDRQRDRFYVLSDDRSDQAPARFYTMKLNLDQTAESPQIASVEFEQVTTLQADGESFARGSIDPEGIALSPRQSVFISSEGVARDGVAPFIDEFDLATGERREQLRIGDRFLPKTVNDQPQGVQDNLGFEALTINPGGYSTAWLEPFRLFAATEDILVQDLDSEEVDREALPERYRPRYSRFLHYLIGEPQTTLISEHLYPIDPPPLGAATNGLTELVVLDQAGHFLTLERSYGLAGSGARIYQIATGGATDTSGIVRLPSDLTGINPIRKQLVLDLGTLGIELDNLEGMAIGPQLNDRSISLILVSDDNFNDEQVTQLLLFRLRGVDSEG